MGQSIRSGLGIVRYAQVHLGGRERTSTEIIADCPMCGKEEHLSLNSKTGLFFCYRCEFGIGKQLRDLILIVERCSKKTATIRVRELLGDTYEDVEPGEGDAWDRIMSALFGASVEKTGIKLPEGCVPIDSIQAIRAVSYLKRRGFTKQHWQSYKLLYCDNQDVQEYGHIVFPIKDFTGQLVFWTTRCVGVGSPKTLHASGVSVGASLFGWSQVKAKSHVMLVEGPLDVLALPGRAVGLMGKHMSEAQASKLCERFETIIVALDADARTASTQVCWMLSRFARLVFEVKLLNGDPADRVSACIGQNARNFFRDARPYKL